MLNHITIMGRLTRDPEFRATASGTSVVNFSVAVDRDIPDQSGEKKTDFINCVAWRKTAEFITRYFTKGSMILVSGRLEMRNWQDKEGNKRVSAEVNAINVYFGESKRSADTTASFQPPAAMQPPYQEPAQFELLEGDDVTLPF